MKWSLNTFVRHYLDPAFFDGKEFEVVEVKPPKDTDESEITARLEIVITKDETKYPMKKDGTPHDSNLYEKFVVKAKGASIAELRKLQGRQVAVEGEGSVWSDKSNTPHLTVTGTVKEVK